MSLRHIVITGGSRGIGLAIAQLFARNNYRCTLISRNEEALKAAINTLRHNAKKDNDVLGRHRYIVGDVSDPEFWKHGVVGKALMLPAQSMPQKEEEETLVQEDEKEKNSKARKEEEQAALLRSALQSMGREDMEVEASSNRLWPKPKPEAVSEAGSESESEPEIEAKAHSNSTSDGVVRSSKPHSGGTKGTRDIPSETDHARKRIDVLVNCAGITENQLFARTKYSAMKGVIDTNLTGLMMGTQYLLRYQFLRRTNTEEKYSPTIINVASLLAVQGGFGAVAYAASKAGVLGFTRALALEIGRSGVRVNAIVPGYIETDMIASMLLTLSQAYELPAPL
jgi:NAD(P)-dependent dehydrogenase (short-subunit alcohol dehydrogenase family)